MTPDQKGSLPIQMEKLFYDLQNRIYADVVPVLYEACKYIKGLKPDLYDPIEEEIKAYLRGE